MADVDVDVYSGGNQEGVEMDGAQAQGLGDGCSIPGRAVGNNLDVRGGSKARSKARKRGGSQRGKSRKKKGRNDGGDGDSDNGDGGGPAYYWHPGCSRGGVAVPPAWIASGAVDDVQQLPVSGVRAFSSLVASGNSLIGSTSTSIASTSLLDNVSSGPSGATSLSQSSSDAIDTLKAFLRGESWKECQDAFQVNSLENIALRCERAEKVEIGLQFVSMINFIQLSAKVERLAQSFMGYIF